MTIDIGEAKTIRCWRVEHAEYGCETKISNTIDSELLYKDGTGKWVSSKKITDNYKAITASEFKLQNHDSGDSPWRAIRIFEWQMFESGSLPRTENILMHFAAAENNIGAKNKVAIEKV